MKRGLDLGFAKHCWTMGVGPSCGTTYSWQSMPSPYVFMRFQHVCPPQRQILSNLSDWALPWWGLNEVMECKWGGLVNEMLTWMNTLGGLEGLTHIGILDHSTFTTCQNSPWLFTTYIAFCCTKVPVHLANLNMNTAKCLFVSLWCLMFPSHLPWLKFGPARSKR